MYSKYLVYVMCLYFNNSLTFMSRPKNLINLGVIFWVL
jgi:hypothetical protein